MELNYEAFFDTIFENLNKLGIDVAGYECDHVGVRTASLDDYETLKKELANDGVMVGEPEVVGRAIAIFKLNQPLTYKIFTIPALELLAPKETDNYQNGPEHLEFVINESFEEFLKKYPNIEFETYRLERKNNPEIKLYFPDKTSVKFHKVDIITGFEIQSRTGEL